MLVTHRYMPIKLLLADDHDIVRLGIRSLLEEDASIGQIEEASNGHEAVVKSRQFEPDVVVLDYEMPNFNGIYAAREILKENSKANILLLSMHQSREMILEGVMIGVKGYLPKNTKCPELLDAIRELSKGGTWFKGGVAEIIAPYLVESVRSGRKPKKVRELTPREREVVKLYAEGESTAGIAEKLSISRYTVEIHKANIYKKLKTNNVSGLTRYAIKKRIINI